MSTEQDYEEMSVEEKVKRIEESTSLGDLPQRVLPPVPIIRPDMYFFISYSHKDYKKVYKDIFALQQQGVNIWYDGGMPVGKNWQEVAEEFILPYKCAGVIFYVSENSLMSNAIHKEMEFAKANGKMCITINLPIESDIVYNGESVQGKELSAQEMLDIMRDSEQDKAEKVITDEKYNTISEMFGYSVLFMPYSTSPENKAEEIVKTYNEHKEPVLIFSEYNELLFGVSVIGVKDIDIKNITLHDFECRDENGELLNVEEIGPSAFANCTHLNSIELPESVRIIRDYAFYNCGFKSISLPRSVFRIDSYAFSKCRNLVELTIAGNVHIGDYSFSNCSKLKNVTIGSVIWNIGNYAFFSCYNLTSVKIQNRVEYLDGQNPFSIGDYAFCGCSSLAKINIPDGIIKIGNNAFCDCNNLLSIKIPDSVIEIGESAFSGCKKLMSLIIGASVNNIGDSAFSGCCALIEIYNKSSLSINKGSEDNGHVGFYAKEIFVSEYVSKLNVTQEGLIVYSNVDDKIVMGYIGVETDLILPQDITVIYRNAFLGCSLLNNITIYDNVKIIDDYAFCRSGISSLYIPSSVEHIGNGAFGWCKKLSVITVDADNSKYKSVGNCLIETESKTLILGFKNSVIPDDGSVTSIGQNAFCGCNEMINIKIPDNVISIGYNAFGYCGLNSITIGSGLKIINTDFCAETEGCGVSSKRSNLKEVHITDISKWCEITFRVDVYNPLYWAHNLYLNGELVTDLVIPDTVTEIKDSAFINCTSIVSVTIQDGVTKIGMQAFHSCRRLTNVTIPNSVISLGFFAFAGCDCITSITFKGTKTQWKTINRERNWDFATGDYIVHCIDGDLKKGEF